MSARAGEGDDECRRWMDFFSFRSPSRMPTSRFRSEQLPRQLDPETCAQHPLIHPAEAQENVIAKLSEERDEVSVQEIFPVQLKVGMLEVEDLHFVEGRKT